MKRVVLSFTAASMILGSMVATQAAEAPCDDWYYNVLTNVKVKGEIRPRYEFVDADNGKDNANALTNRFQFGFTADVGFLKDVSITAEATNVIGNDEYFFPGRKVDPGENFQTVVDPIQSRITQAYIDYKLGNTLFRVGRQDVDLDNQRFIGTVDWRQMPQTYDAAAIVDNSIENLSILAAYVWRVSKVTKADFTTGSVLLHAGYKVMPELTVTGYGYLLEDIHDTYGIAATGKVGVGEGMNLSYRAEYAKQTDPSLDNVTNGLTADADYYNIQGMLNINSFLVGAQYEVLGAGNDGNKPFYTPLATLHAHNGWADKFLLATPANGLVDANVMLGYKSAAFGVAKVIYHDFSSDEGSSDYGTEVDAVYITKIPYLKGVKGMLKAAFYTADDYSVDTTKAWAMLDYKF